MSEWQPIETAPTDGTVVWGKWPGFGEPIHIGRMEYRTNWPWPLAGREYTGWCVPGSGPTSKNPTHWAPLTETPPNV